jgi:DNA repair protein SbcC/Rad50
VREAAGALQSAQAIEQERARGIPANLQDAAVLQEALQAAQAKALQLKAALDRARDEAGRATQQLTACEAQAGAAARNADARVKEANEARDAFEDALRIAGSSSETWFRAAVRSPEQITALAAEIERFHGDLEAAADRLRRAREAASGLSQPDLPQLDAELRTAENQLETAVREQERLSREANQWRQWIAQANAYQKEVEAADAKHRIIAMLAQTAAGRNNRRITLQRFVQVTLLERVLAAAGLDLEILDAHTGQPRRVSTLSGGESFLAALSFALGLSDVVQSQTGGCHLESILVDEGFGSLDPDALDLALTTLRDLQQGGRLVGIISHVPELRQQIDVRLEVTKHKRGSTAIFVLPGMGSTTGSIAPQD